jgi:hypothetical protein
VMENIWIEKLTIQELCSRYCRRSTLRMRKAGPNASCRTAR